MEVRDSSFSNLEEGANHLFEVFADSNLEVHNSSFTHIISKEKGAIFSAAGKGSIIASNSTFIENSATEGAVFVSIQQSLISFKDCTFL